MKNKNQEFYPVALTIAGSDSGGGAGIQVDLRTFNAYGVYGCSAITAITAQNPGEVRRIDPVPAAGVQAQIEAVCDQFAVKWVKTGMLLNKEIVNTVAEMVKKYHLKLVIDPVILSTGGTVLLEADAVQAVKERLLPLAQWITPNIPEAALLLGRKLNGKKDYVQAAAECARRWDCKCLLKGGHAQSADNTVDFVALPDGPVFTLSAPRLPNHEAGHGTGCTLSAALTANLAAGQSWKEAVCEARTFVLGSLADTVMAGKELEVMYPPENDYRDHVKFQEYRKS